MIRRNHIETVTRIDRHTLRYEPKDNYKQSSSRKYPKVDCENFAEQTFRVTSNNKKYHQYKDWKQQHKVKQFEHQRKEPLKPTQQLSQFQTNENQCLNNLKKNYEKQIQQTASNFTSLRTYDKPSDRQSTNDIQTRKRFSQHHYRSSQPTSIQVRQTTQIEKVQINQPKQNKCERQISSPNRRTPNYVSSQKYQQSKYPSSNKYYPPLFDNSLHNKSVNRWQRSEIQSSAKAPGKIAFYQNSMKSKKQDTFRSFEIGGFQSDKTKDYVLENKKGIKGLPINKIANEGQQVSQKLKKISQFNDQINQRIKNIITCFETLKGKF